MEATIKYLHENFDKFVQNQMKKVNEEFTKQLNLMILYSEEMKPPKTPSQIKEGSN